MNTLAIDIGGTKLSMALFEDDRMILRHSQATKRSGGHIWMIQEISSIAGSCSAVEYLGLGE